MVILLIIAGILLELIVLVGGIYLCLKYFRKVTPTPDKIEVKVTGRNITSEVIRDGVKEAIREISFEDEQERIIAEKNKTPESVYSSVEHDTPVRKSGGNLIPYGLTESEREALEMFYGNEN
jgi:hypothetical protein